MRGAFYTTAPLKPQGHGGGSSSYYELQALRNTTNVAVIKNINGAMDGYYPGNPFMADYQLSLSADSKPDIAMFNGGPWSATMKSLNAGKNIVDCPAHNLRISIEEYTNLIGEYPFNNMIEPVLRDMQFQYLRDADIVMTQAMMSIEWLGELGIYPKEAVVVPGGCHYPQTIPPIPEIFGVGYLGAMGADKGISWLLNAWCSLGYQQGHLIIGGKNNMPPEDVALMNQYAPTKCTGWIDNMDDYWKEVTVYVQPSVTEGFGLPVLEAMSYGRPVIVTGNTGASEIVTEGEDGFIIPIRSIDAINDCIKYFISNPEEVERMGDNARQTAKNYTWDKIQKQYEKVIKGEGI